MTNTKHQLIGKQILGLYEHVTTDLGGLDTGSLFLLLDTNEVILFPMDNDYESRLVSSSVLKGASLIYSSSAVQNERWIITDFISLNQSESLPYVELSCGILFTEVSVSPHGTGLAGFKSFESLFAFESFHGHDYVRLTDEL